MTVSDDEYDAQAGGPIELTEQDCAIIDALGAAPRDNAPPSQMPHIDVVLDTNRTRESSVLTPAKKSSPIERYRPSGRLSVSDLVSPAWCEVQFEYGLLQRRSWKLDRRPATFVSREGKQIRVEKKTAQLNDTVLQEGHAVHSALEREVHPIQVKVATVTMEEHWGLRLFNMLSDLQTLILIGKCREFRVMGFIHDHFVTGIIDEITRIPISESPNSIPHKKRTRDASAPSTPSKLKFKRTKSTNDPSSPEKQLKIDIFFAVTPSESARSTGASVHADDTEDLSVQGESGPVEPLCSRTHVLHLIDSKTRFSPSLPEHSATLSSRLQLMTYKRLLDALLTSIPPFNFAKLWKHLGLDPKRFFSEAFLKQVSLISPTKRYEAKCLMDLEKYWWLAVRELGASAEKGEQDVEEDTPIDPELALVYRLRGHGRHQKGKHQQEDSQRTIQESLHTGAGHGQHGGDTQMSRPVEGLTSEPQETVVSTEINDRPNSVEARKPEETLDLELEWAIRESLKTFNRESLEGMPGDAVSELSNENCVPCNAQQALVNSPLPKLPIKAGDIIGQKKFKHDDVMLDAHLTSILAWWHGERDPRGVEVEESNRCHTCEYIEGCEWREKKSFETQESRLVVEKIQPVDTAACAAVSVGKPLNVPPPRFEQE